MAIGRRPFLSGSVLSAAGMAAAFGADAAVKADGGARLFNIRDFGARGEAADDATPAFRRLHAELRRAQRDEDAVRAADPRRPAVTQLVVLPPGVYRTTWNRWTWGVRRVTVFGYGAALQCLHAGPFDVDQAPFIGNRDQYWTWGSDAPTYSTTPGVDFGRMIATARAGATRVTLTKRPEPGLFRPGAWVLVQSYAQQQGGYPPNARYFDWARISATAGLDIELDRPLLHEHRDDWPEDPALPEAPSRARIVAIDRPDCPLALQQTFLGLTTLSNPNHTDRSYQSRRTKEIFGLAGVLDATVRDCSLIALGISQARRVRVERCEIVYTEPDKIVDEVLFDGCIVETLTQCTGVNRMVVRDTTVPHYAQALSREAVFERCTFLGPAAGSEDGGIDLRGPWLTRRMRVEDCRFYGDGAPGRRAIVDGVWSDVPLDGARVVARTHDRFEVPAGTPEFGLLVALLEEGSPLFVVDREGQWPARCVSISGGVGRAIVGIACDRSLLGATALRVPRLNNLTVRGCAFHNLQQGPPGAVSLKWE